MGQKASQPLPDLPFVNKLTSVTISDFSKFVLLYPSRTEIDAVLDAVHQYWRPGIESQELLLTQENHAPKCYNIKLAGTQFDITDKEESVNLRLMITKILQTYSHQGWKLLISTDLSVKKDQTTFIFERQDVSKILPGYINIALSSSDKLLITNSTPDVNNAIKEVCDRNWSGGIQKQSMPQPKTYEIKLEGMPWDPLDKKESWNSRLLVSDLVQTLESKSVMLYGNSNLKDTPDTLFFQVNQMMPRYETKHFFVMSFVKRDRVQVTTVHPYISDAIYDVFQQFGQGSCTREKRKKDCHEFKMKGKIRCNPGHESTKAQLMIVRIVEKLHAKGYEICTGIKLSRIKSDKDVLLFREVEPLYTKFFCLSPSNLNRLTFINAPQDIVEAAKRFLFNVNCQCYDSFQDVDSSTIVLEGSPWSCISEGHGIIGRVVILGFLDIFLTMGWRLVCSADATTYKNNADGSKDVHSLYFMYDEKLFKKKSASVAPHGNPGTYSHASTPPLPPPFQPMASLPDVPPPSYDEAVMGKMG